MRKAPPTNELSVPRHEASTGSGSAPAKTRTRTKGRLSQRSDILAAAVDLFAKGGSRGTPMAAIAERIGVSIPAITHHFGSKYGLFMEVVAVSDSIDEMRTTRVGVKNGIERLSSIRFWGYELSSDSALANLSRLTLVMTAEALDADFPAHEHFVQRHRRFRGQIAETLSDGQGDGSITKSVNPDRLAVEIMAFVQGTVLQWHLDPDAVDLVSIFDSYFDRLIKDLTPLVFNAARSTSRVKKKSAKTTPGAKRAAQRS